MKNKDVLIIGGGIAGMTAAIYAVRNGFSAIVFEGNSIGGQIIFTNEIENYPGFDVVSGHELAMAVHAQAEKLGVEFVLEQVEKIDTLSKTVNGGYTGKYLILAMGQTPRELGLANEKKYVGSGLSYCATCDGMFYKNKTVAIIGGGNTAIADCLHLARFCKKVYVVHRRDTFRANKIEIEKMYKLQNVETKTPLSVSEIIGENKIQGMKLSDGSMLSVDGIFLAIGYTPNTKLIDGQIKLSAGGYILVDGQMKTNVEGVFACGDVTEKKLRQLVTACSDGAIAASNLQ